MTALPVVRRLMDEDADHPVVDTLTLTHDARHLRRAVVTADGGLSFLIDLPQATVLLDGDRLALADGRAVLIRAAPEALLEVRGDDPHHLARLAWHLGNRHLPTQIEPDRLLIGRDHVIADMLARQGAQVTEIREPFVPEGGAYGHGGTHGHSH